MTLPLVVRLSLPLLLVPAAAPAATIFTLTLDPTRSELLIEDVAPLFGPVPLSGSLSIEFDPDPLSAATSFRMLALEATGPGGVVLSLDESAGDPGSGLASLAANGQGALFFQTPILLDSLLVPGFLSGPFVFAPPIGGFTTDPGLSTIEEAGLQIDFVELGNLQILSLSVVGVAVPEPASALLVGSALLGLALRAVQPRRRSRNRLRTRSRASRVG